jgi:hypothetical protein
MGCNTIVWFQYFTDWVLLIVFIIGQNMGSRNLLWVKLIAGNLLAEFVFEWLLLACLYLELINSWIYSKKELLNFLISTHLYKVYLIFIHIYLPCFIRRQTEIYECCTNLSAINYYHGLPVGIQFFQVYGNILWYKPREWFCDDTSSVDEVFGFISRRGWYTSQVISAAHHGTCYCHLFYK